MKFEWLVLVALVAGGLSCSSAKSTTNSAPAEAPAKSTTNSAPAGTPAKSTTNSAPSETPAKSTTNSAPIAVWIDVDTAAGIPHRDIDDAMALIQAFNSPELSIRGVSSVFGNAPLEAGHEITEEICQRFGPNGLTVHKGASQPSLQPTPASDAIATALKKQRLNILALGPVTNVAAALSTHPEIADRIDEVIIVAGRRPGQRFITGNKSARAHRDFNFEKDPAAMKIILQSNVPVTLAPWELSSKVWIDRNEIAVWTKGSAASRWLADHSESWISLWKERFGLERFNPFDTLAVARVVRPDLLRCEPMTARIEWAPDDTPDPADTQADRPMKPFLQVAGDAVLGHPVRYCSDVDASFSHDLQTRLVR